MKKSTMQIIVKIIAILFIVIAVASLSSMVFADQIKPDSLTPDYSGDSSAISQRAGKIMAMIRNIAVIASVIIIMVIGVKYILGSVEEKAEYKKTFLPLIIGIILVVAATSIASFIFNMAE